jgi:hypothetical protein
MKTTPAIGLGLSFLLLGALVVWWQQESTYLDRLSTTGVTIGPSFRRCETGRPMPDREFPFPARSVFMTV